MFNDCYYIDNIKRWIIKENEADTNYEKEINHIRWCYYLEGLQECIGRKKAKSFMRKAKKEIEKEIKNDRRKAIKAIYKENT